ncbi:CoA ester lyase [Microbacterium sp.]|uniref:HpcH/HpaI aldolase/citrate lyase family protein n=1 Tax=Microbacterium sp. TaxID=51671 RepID=UPI00092C3225|nr:CoA ester lyase [Microbacterium sp.]MBN9193874.1 CoA ester lyase [Microbacterium sp.]OJU70098.1 MAG: CoA ester lyase [Microbacterium sp. 70-38]
MIAGPAWLFCPADRPERFDKAADRADAVILDLEDAVLPADRASARRSLAAVPVDPCRTLVRVNAAGTPDFPRDLDAVAATAYRIVMLAKTESAAQLDPLAEAGFRVVALCETAAGIEHADEIARHPSVIALMWGAEDLIGSLGGHSSRADDGGYRDVARYARSRVLIAAGAASKPAVDAVHLDIADSAGLRAEADAAAAVGFAATACIHPSQVPIVRAAYEPAAEEYEWAADLLEEARAHAGVFRFRGRMIDAPVLRQARTILERVARHAGAEA